MRFATYDEFAADVAVRHVTMIGDTPNTDILTRAWNLTWPAAATDVVVFTVDEVAVPTVPLQNLSASKRTGRPQDVADVLRLEQVQRLRADF